MGDKPWHGAQAESGKSPERQRRKQGLRPRSVSKVWTDPCNGETLDLTLILSPGRGKTFVRLANYLRGVNGPRRRHPSPPASPRSLPFRAGSLLPACSRHRPKAAEPLLGATRASRASKGTKAASPEVPFRPPRIANPLASFFRKDPLIGAAPKYLVSPGLITANHSPEATRSQYFPAATFCIIPL